MHATLCDYLADIVQNAIEAGASVINMDVAENGGQVMVKVTDNGKGMDANARARIWDPFYSEAGKHARRRVGLGLPLLRQAVEATGGGLALDSVPGVGTTVRFTLPARHLDTPPLGDFPGTLLGLMTHDGDYDLRLRRTRDGRSYAVSRAELMEALGDLRRAENLVLARDFLRGQEADLTNMDNGEPRDTCPGGSGEELR